MKTINTPLLLSTWQWILTNLFFGIGFLLVMVFQKDNSLWILSIPAFIVSTFCSIPAMLILWYLLPKINKQLVAVYSKWERLLLSIFLICLGYGIAGNLIVNSSFSYDDTFTLLKNSIQAASVLFLCNIMATLLLKLNYQVFFSNHKQRF